MTPIKVAIGHVEGLDPKKIEILSATEQLIVERGFDGTRLRDIAAKAGVSIGKIQHYFESRDSVVHESMSMASWAREREWSNLASGMTDPVEQVRVLLSGSVTDRHRCRIWLETCASSTRYEDLIPMVKGIYAAWRLAFREALDAGVRNGDFEPVVPLDQVLDTIMLMIDGVMVAVAVDVFDFASESSGALLLDIAGRLLQYDFGQAEI